MKYINHILAWLRSLGNPHPVRDWYLVLGSGALAVIALVLVATYFFFGIRSGSIITSLPAGTEPVPSVSREALKNAASLYETRELNYESGNIQLPQVPDPS